MRMKRRGVASWPRTIISSPEYLVAAEVASAWSKDLLGERRERRDRENGVWRAGGGRGYDDADAVRAERAEEGVRCLGQPHDAAQLTPHRHQGHLNRRTQGRLRQAVSLCTHIHTHTCSDAHLDTLKVRGIFCTIFLQIVCFCCPGVLRWAWLTCRVRTRKSWT